MTQARSIDAPAFRAGSGSVASYAPDSVGSNPGSTDVRSGLESSMSNTVNAMADAETLRINADKGEDAINTCWLLLRAAESGRFVQEMLTYPDDDDDYPSREAMNAARTAFRAVPGLRGE